MKGMKLGLSVLAVLAIGVAISGCGSDGTHGSEGTVTLTEPAESGGKHFGFIGKPTRRSIEAGSGFAFSAPLQESGGKTVGEINAFCIATQPSPGESLNGTCSGTANVSGGGFALNVGGKESAATSPARSSAEPANTPARSAPSPRRKKARAAAKKGPRR